MSGVAQKGSVALDPGRQCLHIIQLPNFEVVCRAIDDVLYTGRELGKCMHNGFLVSDGLPAYTPTISQKLRMRKSYYLLSIWLSDFSSFEGIKAHRLNTLLSEHG